MNEFDSVKLIGKLNRAQNKLEAQIYSSFSEDDLHGMQAIILYYILAVEEDKNVYLRDIASEFGLSYAAVSQILKKLKQGGYVVDNRESDDARLRRLTPTDKARALKNRLELDATDNAALDGFTNEEALTLGALLDRI